MYTYEWHDAHIQGTHTANDCTGIRKPCPVLITIMNTMPSLSKLVQQAQTHDSFTFNWAVTNSTSQSHLVDLFFIAWTLIGKNPNDYMSKWHAAYAENKELAMRLLFWMRDIRWGAWVRDAFNYIYHQLSKEDKEHYAQYIPTYWRWKDVFEQAALDFKPFENMIIDYFHNDHSDDWLFCKWFPRKWPVFEAVRKALKITPKQLRKSIVEGSKTVEQQMSANQWNEIKFEHVPSKAMAKYSNAFDMHEHIRFQKFLSDKPEQVKSGTLYPADLYRSMKQGKDEKVIQAQWNNLPNFIQSDKTFLPMIDISGSMTRSYWSNETGITPIMNSIWLGIYLAERNKSLFKNAFLSFSSQAKMHYIEWDDICSKFKYVENDPTMWYTTNFKAAFNLILQTAVDNKLSNDDLPDYIIVLSDMEFDQASQYKTNFEVIKQDFKDYGYEMPKLIFWNLNWRIWNVPVTINDQGVALVSWYSPAIMKSVLNSKVVTAYDVMMETLDNERYKCII